jgi:hypothetical protein
MGDWTQGFGPYTSTDGSIYDSEFYVNMWNRITEIKLKKDGTKVDTYDKGGGDRATANDKTKKWMISKGVKFGDEAAQDATMIGSEGTEFDLNPGGNFDPTSGQFKESIQATGGFGELAKGYGQEGYEFGEVDFTELEGVKDDYTAGKDSLTAQAGKTLMEIKEGQDAAVATSGLESSGSSAFKTKMKEKGALEEYKSQQESLVAEQDRGMKDFWKTTEEKFYDELAEIEGGT